MSRQRLMKVGRCSSCGDLVVLDEDGLAVGHDDNHASERHVFCRGSGMLSVEAATDRMEGGP